MPDERLRELMQRLFDSNRAFHAELDQWLAKEGSVPTGPEPDMLTKTRDEFWDSLNRLFDHLSPVYETFISDPAAGTDGVLNFLEIDIPAFRCGYVKEKLLRRLKRVELTESQRRRLRTAALDLVSRGKFRRELSEWSRLMIVLADESFVEALRKTIKSLDTGAARGAERMLRCVLENRRDLQTNG